MSEPTQLENLQYWIIRYDFDRVFEEFSTMQAQLASVQAERDAALRLNQSWNRAMSDAGCAGSEFIDDPKRCAERFRANQSTMLEAIKNKHAGLERERLLRVALERQIGKCGCRDAIKAHSMIYNPDPLKGRDFLPASEVFSDGCSNCCDMRAALTPAPAADGGTKVAVNES